MSNERPRTLKDKLHILADAAKYDASCASSGSKSTRAGSQIGSTEGMGICHSYTPDGCCVLVCLGATAAKALIGPEYRLAKSRGAVVASSFSHQTIATWHPAAILRTRDAVRREERLRDLSADLHRAASISGSQEA